MPDNVSIPEEWPIRANSLLISSGEIMEGELYNRLAELTFQCTGEKGAADIIGIKPAGSYLPAESVRKWMVFLSAQDESCQHPAQKIVSGGSQSYPKADQS